MPKAIIAALDETLLETKTADSDRFVLSNYVMPLLITFADDLTPLLPGYKRALLNAFARTGVIDGPRKLEGIPALGVGEVIALNRLDLSEHARVEPARPPEVLAGGKNTDTLARLDDATDLLDMVGTPSSESDRVVVRAVRAKINEARAALANAPRRLLGALGVPPPAAPPPQISELSKQTPPEASGRSQRK